MASTKIISIALTKALGAQNGVLNVADVVTATVTFSGAVVVSGKPVLKLKMGNQAVDAIYVGGTNSAVLTFTYIIHAGDTDVDGISIDAGKLTLPTGATIKAVKDATVSDLSYTMVSANPTYKVDTLAPTTTVNSLKFSADTGASTTDFITKIAAQTISGTLSAKTVAGELVKISLDNGATWVKANNIVGQNTFSYAGVLTGNNTLKVRVEDAAGNAGVAKTQAYVLDNAGDDNLFGTAGNDTFVGGAGSDSLDGSEGSDLYLITRSADFTEYETLFDSGYNGTDELRFISTTAGDTLALDNVSGVERIVIGTGTATTAVSTGLTALNIDASLLSDDLVLIGNNGANSIVGGMGNDTLTGNGGVDTFVVDGVDTVLDLGNGADILKVTLGSMVTATVVSAWTATSGTVNQGEALLQTAGKAVDLSAITIGQGFNITNTSTIGTLLKGSGLRDQLVGNAGLDTLTGGAGADVMTGGVGKDTFAFKKGDSGQAGGFDVIKDYSKGAVGVGEVIDFSSVLTVGGSAVPATATQASINLAKGVASFASGSGTTLTDALGDIAARFSSSTDTAGEFALFQVANKGDFYMFMSDGVAGVTTNDDVVRLVGVSSINAISLAGGDLTITS